MLAAGITEDGDKKAIEAGNYYLTQGRKTSSKPATFFTNHRRAMKKIITGAHDLTTMELALAAYVKKFAR